MFKILVKIKAFVLLGHGLYTHNIFFFIEWFPEYIIKNTYIMRTDCHFLCFWIEYILTYDFFEEGIKII